MHNAANSSQPSGDIQRELIGCNDQTDDALKAPSSACAPIASYRTEEKVFELHDIFSDLTVEQLQPR